VTKIYQMATSSCAALNGVSLTIEAGACRDSCPCRFRKSTMMNILGCPDVNQRRHLTGWTALTSLAQGQRAAEIRNRKIGFVFQASSDPPYQRDPQRRAPDGLRRVDHRARPPRHWRRWPGRRSAHAHELSGGQHSACNRQGHRHGSVRSCLRADREPGHPIHHRDHETAGRAERSRPHRFLITHENDVAGSQAPWSPCATARSSATRREESDLGQQLAATAADIVALATSSGSCCQVRATRTRPRAY